MVTKEVVDRCLEVNCFAYATTVCKGCERILFEVSWRFQGRG